MFLRDAQQTPRLWRNEEVPRRPVVEYFHGDNGAGLGASHKTGWTGLIARTLDLFARDEASDWLKVGKGELAARITREQVAGA